MAHREPVRRTAAASSQHARGQRLCLWCLFPISEDVMSLRCGWDSYRAEGGGRAPLGGHRAVPSRRAESAGGPGSRSPAPSARRGKPSHSARLGKTPPAAGAGCPAGARPAAPGGSPRHPCVPLGRPNPCGPWAFRRCPPGGGMPAELGPGDPHPARPGPASPSSS